MRDFDRIYTMPPRPRWTKATSVDELIARITPFVGYLDACAYDVLALELEAALTGDDPENARDWYGREFLP